MKRIDLRQIAVGGTSGAGAAPGKPTYRFQGRGRDRIQIPYPSCPPLPTFHLSSSVKPDMSSASPYPPPVPILILLAIVLDPPALHILIFLLRVT